MVFRNKCLNSRFYSSVSSVNKNLVNESAKREPKTGLDSKPDWIPFSRPKYGYFTQEMPKLENQFLSDRYLQKYLQRYVPKDVIIVISILSKLLFTLIYFN